MHLRHLLIFTAVVAVGFGVGFIVLPAALWGLYGVPLTAEGLFVARLFGTANVGLGLVLWGVRDAGPTAERGAAGGLLGWSVLEALVLLAGQLTGTANALGWSLVGFDAALALASLACLLVPRQQPGAVSPLR